MRVKEISPVGEYVVLKLNKVVEGTDDLFVLKKKSKLYVPNSPEIDNDNPQKAVSPKKERWQAYVHAIGKEATEKVDYKIGDLVIFNDYDAKYVGHDDDNMFIVIKWNNIMSVYEEEEPKEE